MRVAVVGAGPAGIYAADALTHGTSAQDVSVDIIDRLPVPFGLLRYGVAPDHLKMKSLETALQRVLDRDAVRFLGNVEFGTDVSRDELLDCYDGVIYAVGAARDKSLGIEGEDFAGSLSATQFVSWYNGHPDCQVELATIVAREVAVIGLGNVTLDVVRVLAKDPELLASTDMPEHVVETLRASAIETINIVGRGGPDQARFTSKELRELGELGIDVFIDGADVPSDNPSNGEGGNIARNLDIFREWAGRTPTNSRRRIIVHFNVRPIAIQGEGAVNGLSLTRADGASIDLPVQMVIRSVGYRSMALPGVPFDDASGIIPTRSGRIIGGSSREYATGWVRRGPQGVLGTNRSDSLEVVQQLRADLAALPARSSAASIDELLSSRDVAVVTLDGWQRIDAAERALGEQFGKRRTKLHRRPDLMTAAGTCL